MMLAITPHARVTSAAVEAHGTRGSESPTPVAASVEMLSARVRSQISTNLRALKRRSLRLTDANGRHVSVEFPVASDLIATVQLEAGNGASQQLFAGEDPALRRTLLAAVDGLESGWIPREAAADFAGRVLAELDEAIAMTNSAPRALAASA